MASAPAAADVPALSAYARARAADADGRVEIAAAGYAAALAGSPGNAVIAARAYREALQAGDMALARTAATVLEAAGVAPADTALLAIGAGVRDRRWEAVRAATDRLKGGPLDFLAPVIGAWMAHDRGDRDAVATLAAATDNALGRRFNAENRALLLIAGGKADEGIVALQPLLSAEAGSLDLRINAAQLLARAGRGDAARALLVGDDPALAALRDRLGRGAAATAAFGIGRTFTRLAADLVGGDAQPLAIVLARVALELDAGDDRARLILVGALSNERAYGRALALLDAVGDGSIHAASARGVRIAVLERAGRGDEALALAERTAAAPNASAEDAQRLGDLLIDAGRFDAAATAYAMAMTRAGGDAGWVLHLQRGGALDQAGRWREAEAMLARAVELAPDEAAALNYLGYARIERGEKVKDATAMLERAAALKPDDAAITDSLGWAYVRTGAVAKGLPLLERAARAEPADATINEHLGDAYWQAGRRYEARYAWRAAAVYASDAEAARLAQKIVTGLER